MSMSRSDIALEFLMKSNVFERHWYMAQCGIYFHSTRAAAEHFLRHGMSQGASPHPLMNSRVWPQHLQSAWSRGADELLSVFSYFRKPLAQQPPLGDLVTPARLDVPERDISEHAGGLLGWLVEHGPDDLVIPTRAGDRLLGELKSSWKALYQTLKTQNALTGNRGRNRWDSKAESNWRASISSVELPASASQPLVSIVMPAWNRSDLIARAIRSVQSQTFKDWELIVVDDGSTDETSAVVEAMSAMDERLRLMRLPHGGVSTARNAGIDQAKGRWIAFLDTDNAWEREFLELMVRGMTHRELRAAYAGLELHNDEHITYRAYQGGRESLMVLNHIDLNVLVVETSLAKKIKFDPELRRWVDHDFAIRLGGFTDPVLLPFVGCIYDDDRSTSSRITTSESDAWQWVVLGKNWVDWKSQTYQRVTGRVSVVMPVYQDWRMTTDAVNAILATTSNLDIEIQLIDNGSAPHISATLMQLYASHERVCYRRLPRNMNFAIGSNFGAAISTGEFICFLNNDTQVRDGWLEPLLESIQLPDVVGVQPLLLYPDDTIQSAGTVFLADGATPAPFLKGLPPEEALGVESERFNAVTAACLLMRFADVAKLNGFDPIYVNGMEDVDLCLRARQELDGFFAVDSRSRVTHHESKSPGRGLHLAANRATFMQRWRHSLPHHETEKYTNRGLAISTLGGDAFWIPAAQPVVVRDPADKRRRWGIRHSALGGPRGDRWGDTFFADSLARALRESGQHAVTYRHGTHGSDVRPLDHVNVVIRGLDRVYPIPGMVNILWVISHPDDVTVSELLSFDIVYSASSSWAATMTELTGRPIGTLLQATDASIFYPVIGERPVITRPALFVGGNFRKRKRKVVEDALVSGIDLRVIGHGWNDLPSQVLESERIENSRLGEAYRSASLVLADHWPDMARLGFIQNRIFDAAACGIPVISDDVAGLKDVFGSIVQNYADSDELRNLAGADGRKRFGDERELREQAKDVVANHSFDARAKVLIADVAGFAASSRSWPRHDHSADAVFSSATR